MPGGAPPTRRSSTRTVSLVFSIVDERARALCAGPRGRALCAAAVGLLSRDLLTALDRPTSGVVLEAIDGAHRWRPEWPPAGWEDLRRRPEAPAPPSPSTVVARHVARVDLERVEAALSHMAFLPALMPAVNDWAFFDAEVDVIPVLEQAAGELSPVARAIAQAPGAAWWWTAIERSAQRWLASTRQDGPPPITGVTDRLAQAQVSDAEAEARADTTAPFPPRGGGPFLTGTWWAAPVGHGIVWTTRSLPGLPATELALCEDGHGGDAIPVWEVEVEPGARIFEVDGAASWCRLVEEHPREVTLSRRHDWYRWTGWAGRWLIPDWQRVAAEWDGIHVSVAGYLEAAYRALRVEGGRTCLAGWDPDATVWLADVLRSPREVARWTEDVGRNRFGRECTWLRDDADQDPR